MLTIIVKANETMDVTTQEDLILIKDTILKNLVGVEAIYLFGSVARGTRNAGSDYDLVTFVQKAPEDKIDLIANIKHDLSDRIKRSIDFFILNLGDLKFASPFLYEVYHNNILLYGNNVISVCEDRVKDIRPLIIDGEKIGYKMKLANAIVIRHMLDAFDDKRVLEIMTGQDYHSLLVQHMELLCESSTNACFCTFDIVITKEHAFSSIIEKLLIPGADQYKEELIELLPSLHKIQDESIYSRDIVTHDGKIVLRDYADDTINSLREATDQYFELCFKIIESRIGQRLPRNKDELTMYLKTNYPEYIVQ